MRIISNFRDYYDSVQSIAQDQSKVYERKTQEKIVMVSTSYSYPEGTKYITPEFSFMNDLKTSSRKSFPFGTTLNSYIVLIAGKAYIAYRAEVQYTVNLKTVSDSFIVTSIEDMCAKIANVVGRDVEGVISTIIEHNDRNMFRENLNMLDRIIRDGQSPIEIGDSLFFEFGSPVLRIEHVNRHELPKKSVFDDWRNYAALRVISNPNLSEISFQSVLDPYTAFQDISMYLTGVLGQAHPPMVQIGDEDMKVAKGFGHKYAFKNEPTKKRK